MFVRMLRKQAIFSGIEVLSVMSNHIHLLIHVPHVEEDSISDHELLKRYRALYGKQGMTACPDSAVMEKILKNNDGDSTYWRKKLLTRMHSMEAFMRELKQRFSIWFNKSRDNKGTLVRTL